MVYEFLLTVDQAHIAYVGIVVLSVSLAATASIIAYAVRSNRIIMANEEFLQRMVMDAGDNNNEKHSRIVGLVGSGESVDCGIHHAGEATEEKQSRT